MEFGRTLQLAQDSSGVILNYKISQGNSNDRTQAVPIVKRIKEHLGLVQDKVAGDKGFYSSDNISELQRLGVQKVGIPKIGRLSTQDKKRQRSKWSIELQRFRCGIESSISMLNRKFSLGRVLAKGSIGTAIWTGLAIFAYNLWQLT